jgi:hypothetical protein
MPPCLGMLSRSVGGPVPPLRKNPGGSESDCMKGPRLMTGKTLLLLSDSLAGPRGLQTSTLSLSPDAQYPSPRPRL